MGQSSPHHLASGIPIANLSHPSFVSLSDKDIDPLLYDDFDSKIGEDHKSSHSSFSSTLSTTSTSSDGRDTPATPPPYFDKVPTSVLKEVRLGEVCTVERVSFFFSFPVVYSDLVPTARLRASSDFEFQTNPGVPRPSLPTHPNCSQPVRSGRSMS
jgi:hypothetical protein